MAMFITFEGSEGCGKSTQIHALYDFLISKGYDVLLTREPGGTSIGEQIRDILNNLKNTTMQPRTEVLLFQASRAQHVEEIIKPHLSRGTTVLCDRFADSTLAYQGYGYQYDLDAIRQIVQFATGGLKPDLTLLLDIDVERGLQRRAKGGEWNRLDNYKLDFYKRVRAGYLKMAGEEPQRWVVIDATPEALEVQKAIQEVVTAKLDRS